MRWEHMLYSKGDIIQYKKYLGKVIHVFEANKSYMVELYNYKGYLALHKQLNEHDIYKFEQITIKELIH